MNIIEVFGIFIVILFIIVFLLFIRLSAIIYFKKTTYRTVMYWLILYSILSLIVYYLDIHQEPIRYLGYNIIFILTILSYLFLLKIEENGFNSKYLTMLLVSFFMFFFTIILLSPSIIIISKSIILYFLAIIFLYYPKVILINKFAKGDQIKYPIILIIILLFPFILNFIFSSLPLESLFSLLFFFLILFLFGLLFLIFLLPKKTNHLFYINSKSGNFENIEFREHARTEYSNQMKPLIPSKYPLCDKIDDAIKNNTELNFKLYDLKELQFMIICVERRKNELSKISSDYNDIYLLAFALIILPVLSIISSFINYLIKSVLPNIDFIMETLSTNSLELFSNVLNQIMAFNLKIGMLFIIFILFSCYFLFRLFFSVFASNSKIIFWIKNNKEFITIFENFSKFMNRYRHYLKEYFNNEYKKDPFSLIYIIGVLFAFFGSIFMTYYSIKIEYIFSSNILILPLSVFLMFLSVINSNPIDKALIKCNKINLDLNYEILSKNE